MLPGGPPGGTGLQRHPDVLGPGELLDAVDPADAPVSALLDAAEGGADGKVDKAVDPYRSGVQCGGHAMRTLETGGLDVSGQPVLGVVGDCYCFVLGAEPQHGHDRPEDLLTRHLFGVVHVGEDGRRDEVSVREVAGQAAAAGDAASGAARAGPLDVAHDPADHA